MLGTASKGITMRLCPLVCVSMLSACGSQVPAPATSGPRLPASLAASWTTAAPAREDAFSSDGSLLAASDASGLVSVRRAGDWRVIAEFRHPGGATSVAFAKDGRSLFTAGYDGMVRQWNLESRASAGAFRGAKGAIWALDVAPDGSQVAAAGEDGAIRIWSLGQRSPPLVLRGHERNVWDVHFSPDGKTLASGSFDRTARLWDARTGRALNVLRGHRQAVVGLAFSPDGRTLATCGDDSTIRLWRMPDGAALRTVATGNHTYKVAFSPDGRWLASGGRAHGAIGTAWHQLTGAGGSTTPIRIWRAVDWAPVAALPADDDSPEVLFSPNGQWLVSAGEDNRVRIWRLRPTRS
jgi:WD40 repeat protein